MGALLAAADMEAAWSAPVSSPGALGRGREFYSAAALALEIFRGSAVGVFAAGLPEIK